MDSAINNLRSLSAVLVASSLMANAALQRCQSQSHACLSVCLSLSLSGCVPVLAAIRRTSTAACLVSVRTTRTALLPTGNGAVPRILACGVRFIDLEDVLTRTYTYLPNAFII